MVREVNLGGLTAVIGAGFGNCRQFNGTYSPAVCTAQHNRETDRRPHTGVTVRREKALDFSG